MASEKKQRPLKVEAWQLRQRQEQPLDVKMSLSRERIKAWYEHYDGKVAVSFSGGMDSTVLLHFVRTIYPGVPGVFVDSGIEYPEIREHALRWDNVIAIRPEMSFRAVIEKHGYPVVSKKMAQYIREVRNAKGETATKRLRLTGIKSNGEKSPMGMISKKWQYLIDAPFKISEKCCNVIKKKPLDKMAKEVGMPFVGTRADEGRQRTQTYYLQGCNAFSIRRPRSTPLAFWKEEDIWEYVRRFNVPYSKIYDMGYTRTGCMFCMFGVHLEQKPNRFQRMEKTHPKKWKYCMDQLGLKEILEHLKVPYFWDFLPLDI